VIARKVAADQVISTVDTQTRHTRKSKSVRRDGYRAHLATEPETGLWRQPGPGVGGVLGHLA
jgi:hypothetical protein